MRRFVARGPAARERWWFDLTLIRRWACGPTLSSGSGSGLKLLGTWRGLWVLAGLLAAPVAVAAQEVDRPFAALAGDWDRHGFGLTVNDDGTATAVWRVYHWCGPGVPQPCDRLTDNRIISGGRADITFTASTTPARSRARSATRPTTSCSWMDRSA